MELEEVALNIEAIENCCNQVKNPELKRLLENYKTNIEQILGSLAVPLLLMLHGLNSVKYFQYWLQGAVATNNVGKEKTKKGKEEIEEYVQAKVGEEMDIHFDDAKKEIAKLRTITPFLDNAFHNNALNTLVNTWTIFEATIKDLWIHCLNSHPKVFLFNVLKDTSTDIEGIAGKNISIGLLAKYDFDLSNSLGDILANKFDFTTVTGTKKSFKDLLDLKGQQLKVFDNKNLTQLEISRHLIVHNAGTIDNAYLRRTNRKGEKLGNRIKLTTKQLGSYCNSSITTTIKLFKLIDIKITTASIK